MLVLRIDEGIYVAFQLTPLKGADSPIIVGDLTMYAM